MSRTEPHDHDHDQGGAAGVDWFRLLDALVWVSVAVIVILAAEWLFGEAIRARLRSRVVREAEQILRRPATAGTD